MALDGLRTTLKMALRLAGEVKDAATRRVETWKNPAVKAPTSTGGLKLASYNILLGGKDLAGVEKALKGLDADVACLQECSEASAKTLAKRLGMHAAWVGNGKAVLSRYPIAAAKDVPFHQDWRRALGQAVSSRSSEPLEVRSALCVSLAVGGKTLDVLDAHLSLHDPKANAAQLAALAKLAEARRAQGHSVVLAGDLNTNLALARPGARDAKGRVDTVTDTRDEWVERYGQRGVVGNIADAADARSARRLLTVLESSWDAGGARAVKTSAGRLTPEAAARELKAGVTDAKRRALLLEVMDGVTHRGAHKRFDNVLVSPDLSVRSVLIDSTTKASDHQPVLVELGLD